MPSSGRSVQIDLDATTTYHCIMRCVRRAYLLGREEGTGKNYDHRRSWFFERLREVSDVFAIDVCGYAILADHFHIVARVDPDRAERWSDEAVTKRYSTFYPLATKLAREEKRSGQLRERLMDLSWFMRTLNEHVARRANAEEGINGRFWEGRFRSQALLDEGALLLAMAFVDLNVIRNGLASSLSASDGTSIQQRLREAGRGTVKPDASAPLAALTAEGRKSKGRSLGFRYDDYVALLEWSVAEMKKPKETPPPQLLTRYRLSPAAWLATMSKPGFSGITCVGDTASLRKEATRLDKKWVKGVSLAKALFLAEETE